MENLLGFPINRILKTHDRQVCALQNLSRAHDPVFLRPSYNLAPITTSPDDAYILYCSGESTEAARLRPPATR